MSVTPGLGAFNKDKVANKFGIQLKAKGTSKASQRLLNTSAEQKSIGTKTTIIPENKTVSDFRLQNDSNGFTSNTKIINQMPSSQPIESLRKPLESSKKSKSTTIISSTVARNEQVEPSNSNANHSKSTNLHKSNECISSVHPSTSAATTVVSNMPLSSESSNPVKRSNLTPINSDRRSDTLLTGRNKSPETSSTKQTSVTTTARKSTSPIPSTKRANITTVETKAEAEAEHQKDQPLYKRQLSKTLDNSALATNKNKHPQEHLPTPSTTSKR